MLNPYVNITLFLILVAVVITGIYWWIPSYVKQDQQALATHWLLVSGSAATLLINILNSNAFGAGMSTMGTINTLMSNGGKRKH